MIPASFEYHAPKSVEEAIRLLDRHGDEAKLLAGGHSLLPAMKLRLAAPRYVIDIGKLKGLDYIREMKNKFAIGAMTTHTSVETSDVLRAKCALLAETAGEIGDVQVRNRGTIGGSLAHADPAADYPAAILALDAEMVATSKSGTRTIPAVEFFVDMLTTKLRPGEILTEIRVPIHSGKSGTAYMKLHQPASGFAIVGVAVRLSLAKGNKIEEVRVGITGVAAKAYRAVPVENVLQGNVADDKMFAEAAREAGQGVDALSDMHASGGYRKEMAAVFTRRALHRALGRALGTH
ncbi:MAG: xanthine dehydrogenase family protein subunit M [Acidobacteria bacterium]|nr:xanthine dehydrogenase family protein subunit M [Acidobacteriota bacterium]